MQLSSSRSWADTLFFIRRRPFATRNASTTDRVLFVYQHLPHYRFGVFTQLQAKSDSEIHFFAAANSADGSIPVLDQSHLDNIHFGTNIWFRGILWQRGLLKTVLAEDWTAVVFLGDLHFASTWIGAIACRARHVPSLFWTIGWHQPDTGIKRHVRMLFYRIATELLLYGDHPKRFGIEMGYPSERMNVVYNSSHGPNEPSQLYSPKLPAEDPVTIGCIIRLNPSKRLDLLVEAASMLRGRGWNIRVEILGDGPERNRLGSLARQLGTPLALRGAVYDPAEIQDFYDRASVIVIPSEAGLSTTHSLRHGRPVITHNDMRKQAPESEAVIPGITGDLYIEGSIPDLADKIDHWLRRQQTESPATILHCHSEIRAKWTPDVHAEAILTEITRLVDERDPH